MARIPSVGRRISWLAGFGVVLAVVVAGCGGGGGGGGVSRLGRSFALTEATRSIALAADSSGRITVFAQDNTGLPAASAGQGTVAANGDFSVQLDDGLTRVAGNIDSSGVAATGTVANGGGTLFSFTAPYVAPGLATPGSLAGSYAAVSPVKAYLTVDATSHGVLWLKNGATVGAAKIAVAADGALSSADGAFAGGLALVAGGATLTVSRLNGAATSLTVDLRTASRAKWTFMVYLNGANDLQTYGPLNFNQMENVGSTGPVNIVVQWKQANCGTCGRPTWTGTRRYLVQKDTNATQIGSQLVQEMGSSIDMGSPTVLRDFVTWSQQQYPADHYALVIWNHGAGWRPTRAGANRLPSVPRSVSIDDSMNTEIQVWQLPQALNVTPQLDMVVFDASLMQMLEVGYELRNVTPLMVGSEESPPGEGYVYDTFLADLVANPNMTPAQLGQQIVVRTIEAYGTGGNITQSCLDLTKMTGVATAMTSFAASLQAHRGDSAAAMTSARTLADSYAYPENKDLWHYAELIRSGVSAPDLQSAAANVKSAVSAAVLVERHGGLHGDSHGLAVYVPSVAGYLTSYSNLAFDRTTHWGTWLQAQP